VYHQTRLYDLSFVSQKGRRTTKPQIVFTFERKHLGDCLIHIERLVRATDEVKYCGRSVSFRTPVPDLFGNTEFGYERCGLVTTSEEEISFCIELSETNLHNATLTINILTHALLVYETGNARKSNRLQQVDLETSCTHGMHGHSVGGYISGEMREWLRKRWHKGDSNNWMKWVSVPKDVITAMRQAWTAVSPKDQHKWVSHCSGSIAEDGRFILNCMGNACDLAIYPDNLRIDEYHSVRFSCHNLDSARQQLTLLAGLAKLCELARTDIS
jgi:hypothetical protein